MGERQTLAPVILFTYNRPEHTRRTIEALAANELAAETELYVCSDAAKKDADEKAVREIREYIKTVSGFSRVELLARETNYGLAKNIIEGVTELVGRRGTVIVLEDDLVTNRYFLRFMNDGLKRYRDEKQVTGVTGYSFLDDRTDYDRESFLCGLTGRAGPGRPGRTGGRNLMQMRRAGNVCGPTRHTGKNLITIIRMTFTGF